jgi:hypothetical protein
MYDEKKTYVFTGVVTRISPDANHLQIFFSPLDGARKAVVRDASGEPVVWAVELRAAGQVAQDGVTVDAFPPGTIFSIGLHPLRTAVLPAAAASQGFSSAHRALRRRPASIATASRDRRRTGRALCRNRRTNGDRLTARQRCRDSRVASFNARVG